MNFTKAISANILATVLAVATLVMLVIAGTLSLFDAAGGASFRLIRYIGYTDNVESAFILYSIDSTLFDTDLRHRQIRLFDSAPDSETTISATAWGLYEIVHVTAADTSVQSIRMMGKLSESTNSAAMYLADNRKALSLTGGSNITGRLFISTDGIAYSQLGSEFYSGSNVDPNDVFASESDLPDVDPYIESNIANITHKTDIELLNHNSNRPITLKNSFKSPTILLDVGHGVVGQGFNLSGNIILSADTLKVTDKAELSDIIVYGRKVRICNGFSGSVQIVASDTIIVEGDARLTYPSGLFMCRGGASRYVEVGAGASVEGYVVVDGVLPDSLQTLARRPLYRQSEGSVVRGLVWIDGSAEVHGLVSGSLYSGTVDLYLQTGYHESTIYNASIIRQEVMAYPIWMLSAYQRKEIKWMY